MELKKELDKITKDVKDRLILKKEIHDEIEKAAKEKAETVPPALQS